MRNIGKIYETEEIETVALEGIDLTINEGDYISISGMSGSGKSTLLSILGLLDTATMGEYTIEGEDVTHLTLNQAAEIRNQKIGFVFQSFNLIDELTVSENIALPLHYQTIKKNKKEIEKRVRYCLNTVEMKHRSGHKPNQLSGGQQQRVAIARALVADPAILLIDEPTGNLDSKNSDKIMKKIQQLNDDETTICIVTHEARYADMAKQKLFLVDGRLASYQT